MDRRRAKLKAGLEQLSSAQLQRILDWPAPMCFDTYNYDEVAGFY